jgi:predicted Holliday junction resolvase-like endonuclease
MDALKAEIASKRKALDNETQRPNKYMRRGDIERMKEEEESKAREEAAKKAEAEEKAALAKVRSVIHVQDNAKILRSCWSLEYWNQPFYVFGTFIAQRFTLDCLSRPRGQCWQCRRSL